MDMPHRNIRIAQALHFPEIHRNMRPIPASPDASRGICDENRPAPRQRSGSAAAAQQRDHLDPQAPDYPIPLNDCSLVLPPLSEYGEGERGRAGSVRGAAIRATALGKSTATISNHVC